MSWTSQVSSSGRAEWVCDRCTREHVRSMEAEARAILAEALTDSPRRSKESTSAKVRELQAFIDKLYGGNKPKDVVEDLIAERRREFAREEAE